MATMIKGLQYFPLSVDFYEDDIVYLLVSDYGLESVSVLLKLICKIYKNGYYLEWDDKACKIFKGTFPSKYSFTELQSIINLLVNENYFDKTMYEKYHILTSKEIQNQFFSATQRRKSADVTEEEYLLVDIQGFRKIKEEKYASKPSKKTCNSTFETELKDGNANNSSKNVDISKQSKVKESKVKESIVKESKVKILNERESARAHEENSSESSSNNENTVSEVSPQPIDKINAIEAKMYGKSKYENWRQEMLKDNDWLSHVCRSSGKGTRAMDKLELVMNMFESHIISVGEEHTLEKINDYKRRFIYWWRSEKFAPYESLVNRSSENTRKPGRRNGIEYNEETLAELRRMNLEVHREREEQERRKREKEQNYAIR